MTRPSSLLLLLLLSASAAIVVESAVLRDSDGYQQQADAFANDVHFPEYTDNRQLTIEKWGWFWRLACQIKCSKPSNYTEFVKCQELNCTTPEQDNQYEACMNPSTRDHGRKFGIFDGINKTVEVIVKIFEEGDNCVKKIYSKIEKPFIIRDSGRSHFLEDTEDHRQLDLDVGSININSVLDSLKETIRKFICAQSPEAEMCKKRGLRGSLIRKLDEYCNVIDCSDLIACLVFNNNKNCSTILCEFGLKEHCNRDTTARFQEHRQLRKGIWDDIFNHTQCALNPNCTDISQEERDKMHATFCAIGWKSYCLEGAQPHHNFGEEALETLDFDSFDETQISDPKNRKICQLLKFFPRIFGYFVRVFNTIKVAVKPAAQLIARLKPTNIPKIIKKVGEAVEVVNDVEGHVMNVVMQYAETAEGNGVVYASTNANGETVEQGFLPSETNPIDEIIAAQNNN